MQHHHAYIYKLKTRQISGSYDVSLQTAHILRQIVSSVKSNNIDVLVSHIREIGRLLIQTQPRELASGNIVRRVLHLIREENEDKDGNTTPEGSISYSLPAPPKERRESLDEPGNTSTSLKSTIIEGINEIIDELRDTHLNISKEAMEHIHSSEIVMTYGASKTVQSFLCAAARKRKFTVLTAECYPNSSRSSYDMAKELASCGIEAVVIPDSSVFALMSRVNKVILGTHAVLANGGLLAASGARLLAAAAKHHSTPVVVCAGIYKLSPLYPHDLEGLIELGRPDKVISFNEGPLINNVDVLNPLFEYIAPELVDLYITNVGCHSPSYLYRLINDHYDSRDISLDE
ncbi:putative translation initiation factor eIF-2B subunit beta [Neolecta irregularis DAH-3]|uniref:Translation initiation factor eIF2B subunit beta n=1 Tax=Neolecta irregularis (strain DAH-3) TaxID=1198029 RepID=A0A1U7LIZ2_NEOID|nr:putative translation initiation factor eIF-2B subunit beta [Neolecta irregularis DAH-3]|eukprot:OLL22625.1 putative translation initiation factor eIF-2B subunit beta [Neolecta irregularis DAH-3]